MAKKPRQSARRLGALLTGAVLFCFCLVFCLPHPGHHHDQGTACPVCHVLRLPFLQFALGAAIAPLCAVAWIRFSADFSSPREVFLRACSSRAPPA